MFERGEIAQDFAKTLVTFASGSGVGIVLTGDTQHSEIYQFLVFLVSALIAPSLFTILRWKLERMNNEKSFNNCSYSDCPIRGASKMPGVSREMGKD